MVRSLAQRRARVELDQQVGVDLERGGRRSRSHARATSGCSSPIQPSLRSSPARIVAAAARVQVGPLAGLDPPARRRSARAAPRASPWRRRSRPACAGLRHVRGRGLRDAARRCGGARARASRRAGSRRARAAPSPSARRRGRRARTRTAAAPAAPVRGVARGGVEQAGQEQRPHARSGPRTAGCRSAAAARRRSAARSSASGAVNDQATISRQAAAAQLVLEPAPQPLRRVQAADRLRRRSGSVAGILSSPWMRPTSSIRSASRCTSPSRQ